MDEIFIAIMEQIAQEMPELSLIDEDYGQLEMGAEEDQYPVTFPCVLIGNTNSDWHDLGYGAQKSESALTVRLAIDCYDDTSYASGTYDKVRERQQLAKKLYKSLQCLQCTDNASPLVREKSRSYAMPHYIKVYEMTFSFTCDWSSDVNRPCRHLMGNSSSWAAVRRGAFTLGTGFRL
jgi:hypothetical protein